MSEFKFNGIRSVNKMSDTEELEKLLCDSKFKKLEAELANFNIFDCLGVSGWEIRHSNFLAWLLSPNETHGFGEFFLKSFLKFVINENKQEIETRCEGCKTPSVIDIDNWDMSGADVKREKDDIDVLLVDEENMFVLVIENKIGSSQHGKQLGKYKTHIDKEFQGYHKLFIYLKPSEDEKGKIESPYIYVTYKAVQNAIDELLDIKKDKLSAEIVMVLEHYKTILSKKIQLNLCGQNDYEGIYKRNQKAIKLINTYSTQYYLFQELKSIATSDKYKKVLKVDFGRNKNKIVFSLPNIELLYAEIWIKECIIPQLVVYENLSDKDEKTADTREKILAICRGKKYEKEKRAPSSTDKNKSWYCFHIKKNENCEEYIKKEEQGELRKILESEIEKLIEELNNIARESGFEKLSKGKVETDNRSTKEDNMDENEEKRMYEICNKVYRKHKKAIDFINRTCKKGNNLS